jgi:hypothetical protein
VFFDPSETYVHLAAGGSAVELPGGEQFWSMPEPELDRYGHGWLISEFECSSDWPSWEMHPEGEEFVYLLSGATTLLLELPSGLKSVPLNGRAAVVVPARCLAHGQSQQAKSNALCARGAVSAHALVVRRARHWSVLSPAVS